MIEHIRKHLRADLTNSALILAPNGGCALSPMDKGNLSKKCSLGHYPYEYVLFHMIFDKYLALALSKHKHMSCFLTLFNNVVFLHILSCLNILNE